VGVESSEAKETLPRPFSVAARLRSFRHAGRGIGYFLRREHNAWIHGAATIAVIGLGVRLNVSAADWRWLIVAIAMVLAAEALNTAFERLCDLVSPGSTELVRTAKDVAAGAVLLLAIGAALIGLITFAPYIFTS
jgi:diacylglycerol kinase (ATP)